jgi:hypothetical protein
LAAIEFCLVHAKFIDEVFKFSGGIPRLVNKACSETLMYGAQNRKTILDDRNEFSRV